MKRRTFIKAGIALTGLGVVAFFMVPSFKETIAKMLSKTTAQLKIKPDFIDRFIQEATQEQFWSKFSRSKKILIAIHTNAGFLQSLLPYRNKYLLYKGQITGHFLLSTDFFLSKMDSTKPVTYIGFYNPYKQPCFSPFSSNFYRETA
jgi:hypothetical protein